MLIYTAMRRVVITGIGALTPLGNNMNETWDAMTLCRSGVSAVDRFDTDGLPSRIAGQLSGFSPDDYLPRKDIQRLDPFVHYAFAAACGAAVDACLINEEVALSTGVFTCEDPFSCIMPLGSAAIVIGSSRGGISSIERAVENDVRRGGRFSPYLMSASTTSMAASYISKRFGMRGATLGISTACASGSDAVGIAFRMIRDGHTDIVMAGGADAPLCRLALGGYGSSGALSRRNDEPEKASRPFDRDRDGFVLSEGACVLVLEELDRAQERNAIIYAEIIGYGISSDAYHQTRPDAVGETMAMESALRDAGVATDEVGYINAHATSTPLGDLAEAQAIRQVFGPGGRDIPVSACKSMTGHMLGAAGALEAAVTALTLKRGIIVPTINLDNPDPACELNVVRAMTFGNIDVAVTNSFGFGGVNSVLVLKRFV
jgi:3-oxoacyl-[acyl-carrier-protein] synthase II